MSGRLQGLEEKAREIGRKIGSAMPPSAGFALFLFDVRPGGWSTFLSDCERHSMTEALLEHLEKIHADPRTEDRTREMLEGWRIEP